MTKKEKVTTKDDKQRKSVNQIIKRGRVTTKDDKERKSSEYVYKIKWYHLLIRRGFETINPGENRNLPPQAK